MKRVTGNLLIGMGVVLLAGAGALVWMRNYPSRLGFDTDPAEILSDAAGVNNMDPVLISIESIGVMLPVVPAEVQGDKWETTKEGVSYLAGTAVPGNAGNSVMYGHNWNNLLGDLDRVVPGDRIEIAFNNGERRGFKVEYVQIVDPKSSSVLDPTEDRRLTIYTCAGFMDRKRLVVTAFFEEDRGGGV